MTAKFFYKQYFFPLVTLTASLLAGSASAVQTPQTPLDEPILPLPVVEYAEHERELIRLGDTLFHDVRLSADNTISCASCHALDSAGVDGLRVSVGINGAKGAVNAPTVFNSGFNLAQFWDGRAESLEEQAAGPVHNPLEMGSNWEQVLPKLAADVELRERFERLFEDGLQAANIQSAIAAFERSLVTVDAPFDRYLRGEEGAISPAAMKGYRLFKSYGCIACHQGVNVGGNMYHRLGTMADFFSANGSGGEADLGRYNVTAREEDRHVFKVPSLRLATLTGPYFHSGGVSSLQKAVKIMGRYQLGREIPDGDVLLIIEFLRSLVGEYRPLEARHAH